MVATSNGAQPSDGVVVTQPSDNYKFFMSLYGNIGTHRFSSLLYIEGKIRDTPTKLYCIAKDTTQTI